MAQFSFSTLLMAAFFSNILILIISACFSCKRLLVSIGYKMFGVLLGITLLRIIFPVQFSFTANIVLPECLSQIIMYLRHVFGTIGPVEISAWGIFMIVWIIGSLYKAVKFAAEQLKFRYTVILYGKDITQEEPYSRILDGICGKHKNRFRVIELPGLVTPMLYGICRPKILMPEGMHLDDTDLTYLLSHEASHHFHHDILTKLGLNILTIIYWWNPSCYLLQQQLDAVMEMRIDKSVAGADGTGGYLGCLVRIAQQTSDLRKSNIKPPKSSIAMLNPKKYNNLENRFFMSGAEMKPHDRLLHVIVLITMAAIYLVSYCIIFEADSVYPEANADTIEMTVDTTYAVLNEQGMYDIYYGDFIIGTTSDLESYLTDMPVYDSLEKVPSALKEHH